MKLRSFIQYSEDSCSSFYPEVIHNREAVDKMFVLKSVLFLVCVLTQNFPYRDFTCQVLNIKKRVHDDEARYKREIKI